MKRTYVTGVTSLLALAAATACGGSDTRQSSFATSPAAPASTAEPTEWELACPGAGREVIYRGVGTAKPVSYTAQLATGTSQGETTLPLTNREGSLGLRWCAQPGDFLYISLQNQADIGHVTCSIDVDGVEISEVKSSGPYVIAQCDGSA